MKFRYNWFSTLMVDFRQFLIELGEEITNSVRIAFVDDPLNKVLPYLMSALRQVISNPAAGFHTTLNSIKALMQYQAVSISALLMPLVRQTKRLAHPRQSACHVRVRSVPCRLYVRPNRSKAAPALPQVACASPFRLLPA